MVWVVWLRRAMGRHGVFENFWIGPSFSNRVESERPIRIRIESRSFTGPYWLDHLLRRYDRWKFSKMAASLHLGFGPTGSSAIQSADLPWRPYHRTKHEADRMIRCRDMAVRNFPKCEVGRSVIGPQYIYTLLLCTPLRNVRNVACKE